MKTSQISFKQGIVYNSKLLKEMPPESVKTFKNAMKDLKAGFPVHTDLLLGKSRRPAFPQKLTATPVIHKGTDEFIKIGESVTLDFSEGKQESIINGLVELIRLNFE